MEEVKEAAEAWEKQAQASLQQLDRLKDILEESASWSGSGADPGTLAEAGASGEEAAGEGDGAQAAGSGTKEGRTLEKTYLQVTKSLP